MKSKIFIFFGLLILVIVTVTPQAQIVPMPEQPEIHYMPEMWRGENWQGDDVAIQPFGSDFEPDSGFYYLNSQLYSESKIGYPMHSCIITGVSDTFRVVVSLFNKDTIYQNIDPTVESWWQPAIWEYRQDVRHSDPVVLPSSFGYQFKYWALTKNGLPTARPTSIGPTSELNNQYELMYYMWGLPEGRYQVLMNKTSYAPTSLQQVIEYNHPLWITKAFSKADTLNAWAECAWRASDFNNYSAMESWGDSILAHNLSSLVGYLILNFKYHAVHDTLNANTTFDSLFYIANRFGDPVLGDSVTMNKYQRGWLKDFVSLVKMDYWRWKGSHGRRVRW